MGVPLSWFVQYFFALSLDLLALLASCLEMQSFVCAFVGLLLPLAPLSLLGSCCVLDEGAVRSGWGADGAAEGLLGVEEEARSGRARSTRPPGSLRQRLGIACSRNPSGEFAEIRGAGWGRGSRKEAGSGPSASAGADGAAKPSPQHPAQSQATLANKPGCSRAPRARFPALRVGPLP